MVNGSTSRLIYLGAWVCILACIIGIVILSVSDHETPGALMIAMTGAFGVITGSHIVSPPITREATEKTLTKVERDLGRNTG